jgi:hypothetical protein
MIVVCCSFLSLSAPGVPREASTVKGYFPGNRVVTDADRANRTPDLLITNLEVDSFIYLNQY